MFVVSHLGLLHGPFKTAASAAEFGGGQVDRAPQAAPWTIIPVHNPEPLGVMFETIGSDAPPRPSLLKRLSK
jgi:hypothetical protein